MYCYSRSVPALVQNENATLTAGLETKFDYRIKRLEFSNERKFSELIMNLLEERRLSNIKTTSNARRWSTSTTIVDRPVLIL